jgi:hypothetical protein
MLITTLRTKKQARATRRTRRTLKKDVPGQAVDETDPKAAAIKTISNSTSVQNKSATGEDPSVEDDYKGDKDDPGTEHPADAESVGEKYSSMQPKEATQACRR